MPRVKSLLFVGALSYSLIACKKQGELPAEGKITPMKEYSIGNSREWVEMEKQLAPQVKKSVHNGRPALLVEVPNAKADQSTYIEKIGVMTMDGKELAVENIGRGVNPKTYAYFDWELLPWSGKIKAFVKWNKYDLWVQEISVKDIPGNK